jgi:hypothetical protein
MGLAGRIPHVLGGGNTQLAASTFTDTGVLYDVAIGGLPFQLATSDQAPSERRTAAFRTQQIDQSTEPGEQSVVQWWIESQSTFHLGNAQKFMDSPAPGNEGVRKLRYWTSTGINPWSIGQVKLLHQTTQAAALSPNAGILTADTTDGENTRFFLAAGSSLYRVTETVVAGVPSYLTEAVTVSPAATILSITTDGTYYYLATSGFVFRGAINSTASPTEIYTMPAGTSGCVLGWVKQRLVAAVTIGGGSPAAKIYTLLSQPGSPPAAFPTENYSYPNPGWTFTAITEGPSAIYVAGHAGNVSTIDKFVLDNQGNMPTLSGASTAAAFPPSEIVLGMTGYVGTVLGIATSKGFRVGQFVNGNGDVSLGPLSVTTSTLTGAVTASDRFFYCGGTHDDGTAGIWRIDTSQPIHIKQFSYIPDEIFGASTDLRAADGSENPIAGAVSAIRPTVDGRMGLLVPGFGLYVEHPTKLVPTGTLTTSKMRYQTLDPKLCRFVRFRGEADPNSGGADSGSIAVAITNDATGGQTVGSLMLASASDTGDMSSNLPASTEVQLIFTLTRSAASSALGPILDNYQLKALPAQRRQREIILPLSVFDNEKDNAGNEIGGDGNALARLRQLEEMEDAGDIVTLQYLGAFSDQLLAEFVVIDKIEFAETTDPTTRQGWGGIAVVTLRTLT